MSDIDQIIEEDKREHPSCGYSRQFSKECRSVNGKMKCEEIQRIFRVCPGKRPVEIHSMQVTGDDDIYQDMEQETWDDNDDWSNQMMQPFGFNMEQIFQQQMLGLMQLSQMFQDGDMEQQEFNNDIEQDNYSRYTPFGADFSPVPQTRRKDPVNTPSFVAPHTNQPANTNRAATRSSNSSTHRFSDFEGKTKEFSSVC